jgi:uncharacterized phage protein (TIGR02218 family)
MDAAALQTTSGLAVDNTQAVGALTDAGISEEDIRAGRFDEASVEHWLVDWRDPERRILKFAGAFGEIRWGRGRFEVELRGPTEILNKPIGRSFARRCDRLLGDEKCRVDLSRPAFFADGQVAKILSRISFVTPGMAAFDPAWFLGGKLLWTSGRNEGDSGWIKLDARQTDGVRRLDLWIEPGFTIAAGDRFRVFAGCDKHATTCRSKFDNFLNFRGFPHIPGDDWVAAYPKSGDVHDGKSLFRS